MLRDNVVKDNRSHHERERPPMYRPGNMDREMFRHWQEEYVVEGEMLKCADAALRHYYNHWHRDNAWRSLDEFCIDQTDMLRTTYSGLTPYKWRHWEQMCQIYAEKMATSGKKQLLPAQQEGKFTW